jgi:WhiB family redox-sensing transcriptional regulator
MTESIDLEPLRPLSPRSPAACADGTGGLTARFFSDDLDDIAWSKRLCATCPVTAECLSGALDRKEQSGVWGGQLLVGGRVVVSKRRRGRPPHTPRPSDQLPQVPIAEHLQDRVRYAPTG